MMSYYEWSHQPPPHGRSNLVCADARCECDDCAQYWRWLPVAEELGEPPYPTALNAYAAAVGQLFQALRGYDL